MEVKIISTSIVIVAEAHNPTILHPSFLRAEGIVPQDWELGKEPPLCTPAISIVRFANQISFVVDTNKMQLVDASGGKAPSIAELADRYVRKLPHVHYSAVGVNVAAFAECPNPEDWILKRFVKEGAWSKSSLGIKAAGLRLVYDARNAQLNVNLDVGTGQPGATPEHSCIAVNGNYHTPIKAEHALEQTASTLSLYSERIEHFRGLINTILNG